MRVLTHLFIVSLLVFPVFGAQWSSSALFVGDIGVIANNEHSYRISDQSVHTIPLNNGSMYLEGSISDGMVSGKGDAGFKSDKTVNSDIIHSAESITAMQATNGGVAWDEASMVGIRSPTPPLGCDEEGYITSTSTNETGSTAYSESITGQSVVMGHDFVHNSYKLVEQGGDSDNWNMEISGTGNNSATMDVLGYAKTGFDVNETELNFDMDIHEHLHKMSNSSTKYQYSGKWVSFEDTFKGSDVESVLVDESTSEPVNSTEEEINGTY